MLHLRRSQLSVLSVGLLSIGYVVHYTNEFQSQTLGTGVVSSSKVKYANRELTEQRTIISLKSYM